MKTITFDENGTYRWIYELNLHKNPAVFFTIMKILLGVNCGIFLFLILIETDSKHFMRNAILLGETAVVVSLVLIALGALGYFIYTAIFGKKYCVLFEMDENGITHRQLPPQIKKAEAIAALSMLLGAAAGKPGLAGTGILAATHTELRSTFAKVTSIEPDKRLNLIKVNEPLCYNQVYADGEDFDFVLDYIKTRVKCY